jgi:hypothetical protein
MKTAPNSMIKKPLALMILAASVSIGSTAMAAEASQSNQSQAEQIAQLKQALAAQQEQLNALTAALESQMSAQPSAVSSSASGATMSGAQQTGAPQTATTAASPSPFSGLQTGQTSLGGYAEVHYNNLNGDTAAQDKTEIDLHRFVLFLGHQFSEDVRFYSELEVEHAVAGEGADGEVELEQAFIEWDYMRGHAARAGVFLMPVGLLNETHEPDTFYGVERNNVERNIIPTTWWEAGLGASGEVLPGLSYNASVTSGLKLADGDFKVRDGRQKASEADANDLAYTAALSYVAAPGVTIGGTVQYQSDLTQSDPASTVGRIDGVLTEAHIDVQRGNLGLRALVANWSFDDEINQLADGADQQFGWYLEPSYLLSDNLGVFARYSEWDNQAGANLATKTDQIDLGFNYWLVDNVVLKADYQIQDSEANKGQDGFNLGVGWSF